MSVEAPKDILVVGPPGSGKTALAESFASRNRYAVVDFNRILIYIATTLTHPLQKDIYWHITNAAPVKPEIVKEILTQEINIVGKKGIVFDGAVKNRPQLEAFQGVMQEKRREYITAFIWASINFCIQRMLIKGRGEGYDDSAARSIKEFEEKTVPVMNLLAKGDGEHYVNIGIEEDIAFEEAVAKAVNSLERFMSLGKKGFAVTEYLAQLYEKTHQFFEYYETAWRRPIRQKVFLEFVRNHGGINVVDLGCRDGLLTSELSRGKKLTGIDIDPEALRRYKIRYANQYPDTIQQDLNYPIDLPSNSQDIVIAGELMEHLIDPANFISEVHRILRPGGMFIGSTPNALRWDKRLNILIGQPPREFSDPTHIQHFSQNSISRTLRTRFDQTQIYPFLGDRTIGVGTPLFADGFIWRCIK